MRPMIALVALAAGLAAACGGEDRPEEPAERLDKPYADKVREIEQQNLQRVQDQMKEIDKQSDGKSGKDDEDG